MAAYLATLGPFLQKLGDFYSRHLVTLRFAVPNALTTRAPRQELAPTDSEFAVSVSCPEFTSFFTEFVET